MEESDDISEEDGPGPGLGDEDFPGFDAELCPETLPDLSRHHSACVEVIQADPSIYESLRGRRTSLGVGLARCLKPGMDNRGHPFLKTAGLVAGDEECYETFREIFDPVICQFPSGDTGGVRLDKTCGTGEEAARDLETLRADVVGKYVLSSQVRASRSLSGYRFPPAMFREERIEVEHLLVQALTGMDDALAGKYYALRGSQSFVPQLGGMGGGDEEDLHSAGFLFKAPDSTYRLCSGAGRHWPDGRGVYVSATGCFAAWVNEQEHLLAISRRPGDAVQLAFEEVTCALDSVAGAHGIRYASTDRLGFLTSNPLNLGTAMQVSMALLLPLLAKYDAATKEEASWRGWCTRQGVYVCSATEMGQEDAGIFEISNSRRLGISEAETVRLMLEVAARSVQMEQRLEIGEPINELLGSAPPNGEEVGQSAARSAVAGSPAPSSLESLQARVQWQLTAACSSGRLDEVMGQAMGQTPIAESAVVAGEEFDTTIDALTRKLHDALLEAMSGGKLDDLMDKALGHRHSSGHIIPGGDEAEEVPPFMPHAPCAGGEAEDGVVTAAGERALVLEATEVTPSEVAALPGSEAGVMVPQVEDPAPSLDIASELLRRTRRIGQLTALIQEAEQQLIAKDAQCSRLEQTLGSLRVDLAHMDLDLARSKRVLEAQSGPDAILAKEQYGRGAALAAARGKCFRSGGVSKHSPLRCSSALGCLSTTLGGSTATGGTPRGRGQTPDSLASPESLKMTAAGDLA
eukprot:CAMPEP_0180812846 /NCGR_PEP_ID=MMETSP1038_2-20121128/66225_1 /TAXON_ID=632150 /ORGANISM="Azadinium spinosum, Strain 3D9" /LENGTH=746 /DNA_ID=CAMNT_0022854409 /DNA_START=47 /DNA_END=2284 /DNA_ORIENTATION=-